MTNNLSDKENRYQSLAKQINESPYNLFYASTGGGQSFPFHYMKYSGASKTIAGMFGSYIPYGKVFLEEFVGQPVEKYASIEVARLMATQSYIRCVKQIDHKLAIGIGLTCSLTTDDEREGRLHRIFVALHGFRYTRTLTVELKQGLTRDQEESFCCEMVFELLASYALLSEGGFESKKPVAVADYLVTYKLETAYRDSFNSVIDDSAELIAIAPGSWNPIHIGHQQMLNVAEQILGCKPYAELTTLHIHKGALDYFEVAQRFSAMEGVNVLLTSVPSFKEKALEFSRPNRSIVFVVGADVWNKILDPVYTDNTQELYRFFVDKGATFMVFNRNGSEIKSDPWLDNLLVRDERLDAFNVPISSSQIRDKMISDKDISPAEA